MTRHCTFVKSRLKIESRLISRQSIRKENLKHYLTLTVISSMEWLFINIFNPKFNFYVLIHFCFKEFGEWETAEVSVDAQKYTIENLLCGSRYQVYATGFNKYLFFPYKNN